MELTRFSGHLDTWDHESHKEARYDPKVHPEYPPELRAEAVRLVRDGGRPFSAAAKDLGVSAESLRHWVKQYALDSGVRKDGLTTDERKELVRLRRENRDLREDREILKRATAFFAKETRSTR